MNRQAIAAVLGLCTPIVGLVIGGLVLVATVGIVSVAILYATLALGTNEVDREPPTNTTLLVAALISPVIITMSLIG
jgi:hypothetical protein